MSLEGSLVVRLAWDGRRVHEASVRSTRPHGVARVLRGRSVSDAAAMLPRLYSVCAFAQGAAGAAALAAAVQSPVSAGVARVRALTVALEALQEDLRRLLIDLPAVAEVDGRLDAVIAARRDIAPLLVALRADVAVDGGNGWPEGTDAAGVGKRLRALVERDVLGMDADAFAAIDSAAGVAAWAASTATPPARLMRLVLEEAPRLGASEVPMMPTVSRASISEAVLAELACDPSFARVPHWQGSAVETGALARRATHAGLAAFVAEQGAGVAARLFARTLEVAALVVDLVGGRASAGDGSWSPAPEIGVACVDAARGLLLHRAHVREGRVADYAIVAPTEWNFHPAGALVRGLSGLAASSERRLRRDAQLVVQSLDPCVACAVEIADA